MQNERAISSSLRASVNASASGELLLTFVTITHPNLAKNIYVVTEDDGGVSYANGLPVNYRLDGLLYLGVPFRLSWLSDGENAAEARATIPAISKDIGDEVRSITQPVQLRMRVLKSSDFDVLYDQDNARNPIGTPTVELDAKYLFLRDIQGNGSAISGRVVRFDMGNEPYPPQRAIKSRTPSLFL